MYKTKLIQLEEFYSIDDETNIDDEINDFFVTYKCDNPDKNINLIDIKLSEDFTTALIIWKE